MTYLYVSKHHVISLSNYVLNYVIATIHWRLVLAQLNYTYTVTVRI